MNELKLNLNYDGYITINLESNTVMPGSFINAEYNIPDDYRMQQIDSYVDKLSTYDIKYTPTPYISNEKIISTYDDIIEHFTETPNKYFVTGYTDSKFMLISKYFTVESFNKIKNTKTLDFKKYGGNLDEISQFTSNNKMIRLNNKLIIPGLNISVMILNENTDGSSEYVLYLDTKNPIKYIDYTDGLCIFKYMRNHNESPITTNMILYEGIIDEPKITSDVFINRGYNSAFESMKKLKNIKNITELTKSGLGYYKINTNGYNFKQK